MVQYLYARQIPLSRHFPPGKQSFWTSIRISALFFSSLPGGGSDRDVPVRELPDYYRRIGAPAGKTDVLFITDAICRVPEPVRDAFLAWKKAAQARLITLVIQSEPGDLAALSDEVYRVSR